LAKEQQEKKDLNNTIKQLDPTGIYRTVLLKTSKYKIFSGAHKTFLRIDYILGHICNIRP